MSRRPLRVSGLEGGERRCRGHTAPLTRGCHQTQGGRTWPLPSGRAPAGLPEQLLHGQAEGRRNESHPKHHPVSREDCHKQTLSPSPFEVKYSLVILFPSRSFPYQSNASIFLSTVNLKLLREKDIHYPMLSSHGRIPLCPSAAPLLRNKTGSHRYPGERRGSQGRIPP